MVAASRPLRQRKVLIERGTKAMGDAFARLLAEPGTLVRPSMIVRCQSYGTGVDFSVIVDRRESVERFRRVLKPLVERFQACRSVPFDFFFLVSDNIYPSLDKRQALTDLMAQVTLFRSDQRPDDPLSMAAQLVPDFAILDPRYRQEFSAVVTASDQLNFERRKGKVVWRGRLCGPGLVRTRFWHTFPRYELLRLASRHPDCIHAAITDNSNLFGSKPLDNLRKQVEVLAGPVDEPWPMQRFVGYKYLLSLDGVVAAWKRVPLILASGSVLLIQSNWVQDFYTYLRPWHDHVPIADDLSDLLEAFDWLEAHPEKAKEIGANGRDLALKLLTPQAIEDRFFSALEARLSMFIEGNAKP